MCVCVSGKGKRGGSPGPKMEGTSPNHCTLAPTQRQKRLRGPFEFEWQLPFSTSPLILFLQPPLPFSPSPHLICRPTPKEVVVVVVGGVRGWLGDKDRAQSNQANSANKSSVGSSLPVLTHFTVSVAKQKLECLATGRHSILMEWRPHARLPCAWSV